MKSYICFLFIIIYSCSDKPIQDSIIENHFYDKAWYNLDRGESLNAFTYFSKAKEIFLKNKDSLGVGKCLMNMGIISTGKNDYFGGLEISLEAKKYFNENKREHYNYIRANYNNLGIASFNLKDYKNAIKFYDLAIKFSENQTDKNFHINNKAILYKHTKSYSQSILLFKNIKTTENITINDNLALTKWLQNPKFNPIPEFEQALKIRIVKKDLWGQNASYAHLADYYSRKKNDSALFYAKKMFDVANQIKSPDDQIEALQKLIILDSKNYSSHFNRYQFLNDSLQTARNKAKNQFALIRYETEKSKADNLKLQKDNTEKKYQIIKQKGLTVGVSIFAIILIISGSFWYRKRKQRMEQEKLLEVKNTELKYSKKVHDRVANRIYQILSQVENTDHIDKDSLLFGLENVYETSRNIAYENTDVSEKQNFRDQLSNMLTSYSSKSVHIFITGNEAETWENTNLLQKTETYLILQELMTNMKKHSQADKVSLKFLNENSRIFISYIDNGIGINELSPKNGLQNMENRIISINGKINFDTETKNVLKINLSFPL